MGARHASAHRGSRELEPDRVHRLLIEDLVARDRERSYGGLLGFLGQPDSLSRRRFFEHELTPERARIGRWRRDLPQAQHERADALYLESLARLRAAGVAPLPPAVAEVEPTPTERSASSVDPWALATA